MCWKKALTFSVDSIKLSFRIIVFTQYMQRCFQYVITFQLNCAEGLHFSAFLSMLLVRLDGVAILPSNRLHSVIVVWTRGGDPNELRPIINYCL